MLFTSGSLGSPRGVVLTHRNVLANVAQLAGRIGFARDQRVLNALPMFHGFGLTAGFVLPVVSGIPAFLYPSPLHYGAIPQLAYSWNATALFGTSTFLRGYARRAHPLAFRSLRLVIAGAEPLAPAVRELWFERFGLRILEGYGVTECSPVLAVNTPASYRSGTVGRLLPGLEARLLPVEGLPADSGRLLVRGPNVMAGYLTPDGTLLPPPDGWHDTGDVVRLDPDGHLSIVGRLARFAKAGGEMIPLAAVEALAHALWPDQPRRRRGPARPPPRRARRAAHRAPHRHPRRPARPGPHRRRPRAPGARRRARGGAPPPARLRQARPRRGRPPRPWGPSFRRSSEEEDSKEALLF